QAYQEEPFFLNNPPHVGLSSVIPLYLCPSDGRTQAEKSPPIAFLSYLGVEGVNQYTKDGLLFLDSRVRLIDVLDGASNTLLVGERPPSAGGNLGWWYAGWGLSMDGSGDMDLGVLEINASKSRSERDCKDGPYKFGPGSITVQCDALH